MRMLASPLVLILIAVIAYLVVIAARGPGTTERAKAVRRAEWTTGTDMQDGRTIVVVRQVAEVRGAQVELARQVVAEIPDAAPDWEQRYHEAMAEARARAAALRSESD
ncbi:MAG TPA: hypothetical protein VF069_19815 [Streptosporangiaceae bacterium]